MANITGVGAPTRKTIGAIGDIYTDTNTGKRYECGFAYRSDNNAMFDCEWRELKILRGNSDVTKKEEKPAEIEAVVGEPTPEKVVEPEIPTEAPTKRKDYSSYGKKNK